MQSHLVIAFPEVDVHGGRARRRGAVAKIPLQLVGILEAAVGFEADEKQLHARRFKRVVDAVREVPGRLAAWVRHGGGPGIERMGGGGRRHEGELGLIGSRPGQGTSARGLRTVTDRLMDLERVHALLELDLAGDLVEILDLDPADGRIAARAFEHLEAVDEQERGVVGIDEEAVGSGLLDLEEAAIGGGEFGGLIGPSRVAVLHNLGHDGVADDLAALFQTGAHGRPARQIVAGPVAQLQRDPLTEGRVGLDVGLGTGSLVADAVDPVPRIVAVAFELNDGVPGRIVR